MNQIAGSSIPLIVKGKIYLVGYVSIREWDTFDGMLLLKGQKNQALFFLFYCALHRADSGITKRKVQKIVQRHPEVIIPLIDIICDLSLPEKTKKGKVKKKKMSKETKKRNSKTAFRILSRMHGWTPEQIGNMSPAQFYFYMMGGSLGTGIEKMSGAEYQKFLHDRGMLKDVAKKDS